MPSKILYNPVLAIVKISILIFLLRLTGTRKAIRHSISGLIAFTTALMLAIFITVIFQCLPIAYNWDTSIEGGHCVQQGAFYVATTVLTLVTDILVLPLQF
jgi:high-affinity K+ transport system ATPase subunit B